MLRGDREKYRDSPIALGQSVRNTLEHPCAAQVQPVDMGELGIGTVRHYAGLQPTAAAALRDARQKRRQPSCKCVGIKDSSHEVRLGETGREEILAGGLIAQRAIAVLHVETLRRILQ